MPDRVPLIAGNWKMFKTVAEAVSTAGRLAELVDARNGAEVMIAPSFIALNPVARALEKSPVALGAQDLYWEKEGAYTGEVSADMLVSAGCSHVIIGHSERRQYFGETDTAVNRKIGAAIAAGLVPVLCVGESEKARESQKTLSVLDKQVKMGLEGYFPEGLGALVVAYEPVWAIGTGKTATKEQAQEVHAFLRSLLEEMYSADFAARVRILYGGSVKPANIAELMAMPDVDGALVGGASLDADVFSQIVNF